MLTVKIGDMNVVAESITAFKIRVGTAAGGPYTTSVATVPLASMTSNNNVYMIDLASVTFTPPLQNGVTYFAVAEADNAGGESPNSPETSFQIVPAPTAPISFSIS